MIEIQRFDAQPLTCHHLEVLEVRGPTSSKNPSHQHKHQWWHLFQLNRIAFVLLQVVPVALPATLCWGHLEEVMPAPAEAEFWECLGISWPTVFLKGISYLLALKSVARLCVCCVLVKDKKKRFLFYKRSLWATIIMRIILSSGSSGLQCKLAKSKSCRNWSMEIAPQSRCLTFAKVSPKLILVNSQTTFLLKDQTVGWRSQPQKGTIGFDPQPDLSSLKLYPVGFNVVAAMVQ